MKVNLRKTKYKLAKNQKIILNSFDFVQYDKQITKHKTAQKFVREMF